MHHIFRPQALERCASPEPLDQLMRVVRPTHWLALATLGALVGMTLLWGLWGRLSTTVLGRGVLIQPQQVVDVQSPAAGRLLALAVQIGEVIRPGDVLGTIEQVEIRQHLQEERARLQELLAQDATKSALQTQHTGLQAQHTDLMAHTLGLQRNDLHKRLRDAQARTSLLKQRFENRARLEALGLLPKISDERLQAEHAYLENQDTIADLQAKLTQLDSAMKQLDSQAKQLALQNLETSTARKNALQELRGRIALLEVQLAEHSRIVSQHSGRMLELTVHAGQVLQVGQRLGSVAVEEPASKLVGLLYLPIKAGKKVAPGMTVQVAPDTVARERFGSILGTVTAVSAFPVTREGMARLLGNADLVAALANQGPTLEVTTELTRDAATVSGYRWSSSAGPALRLTAGTTMTGRVVVEQRTPITYLLPFLRDSSGLY